MKIRDTKKLAKLNYRQQKTEAVEITAEMRSGAERVLEALPEIPDPAKDSVSELYRADQLANRTMYVATRNKVKSFIKLLDDLKKEDYPHLFRNALKIARQARLLEESLADLHMSTGAPSFLAGMPEILDQFQEKPEMQREMRNAIVDFSEKYKSFLGEYKENGRSKETGRGGR